MKAKVAEMLLKLNLEKQLRCGDGAGKPITTHSLNCRCQEIDEQIKELSSKEE
jgi:hypothetical protein